MGKSLNLDDSKISSLYRQKLSAKRIGKELGCSDRTILDHLKALGIPARSSGDYHRKFFVDPIMLLQLYHNGLRTSELAAKFGMNRSTVLQYLHKAGLPYTSQGEINSKKTPALMEKIEELYVNQGLPSTEVAKGTGLCIETTCKWLRDIGKLRSIREAQKLAFAKGRRKLSASHIDAERYFDKDGYVYIKQLNQHRANRYVPEHIVVWETYHNRKLPTGWVVHHLNGIKSDNRPENLVGKPKKSHDAVTRLEPYRKRIRQLEIENRQLRRTLENSQMILYVNEN